MNIVYFIPHLKNISGMERVICVKANYMADVLGYNVTIITYRQYDCPIAFDISPKVKFEHLNIEDPTFRLQELSFFERRKRIKIFMEIYRQKVEEYLKNHKTDIVISTFLGTEYKFLTSIKDGSKKILELHFGFDATQFRFLKKKIIWSNFFQIYQVKKLQKIINSFDKIVVLTDNDAEDWRKYFSKVEIISNPITITESKPTDLERKSAIAVGRLSNEKGFDYLIDAWRLVHQKNPDWTLDIYGGGALEETLKQQIKDNGLQEVIRIHPPTDRIADKYAEHSIFVLSSRHEGFVLSLLEAMSLGLACVSFDCKHGPKQMIDDGESGFLVELGNTEVLAEKINTLIENEKLRKTFAHNAKIRIREKYGLDTIMPKWTNLFNKLISK